MEIQSLTLTGLAVIGIVNVIDMFKPDLDSRMKFGLSVLAALLVSFIPVELGTVLLDKIKEAIMVAFAASGTYKLAQKIGDER